MFDTHCHLNFKDFKTDGHKIAQKCLDQKISLIVVGSQLSTSQRAVDFANKYPKNIYAAVGLHPSQVAEMENIDEEQQVNFQSRAESFDPDKYQKLIQNPKVKAIGEIGLDYFFIQKLDEQKREENIALQKKELQKQIDFANKNHLPVILHVRDIYGEERAYEDLAQTLNENETKLKEKKGVVHCYTHNWTQAKKYLDLGFYIGFTGVITYDEAPKLSGGQKKRVEALHEVVKKMPKEKVLSETDCPWLLPEPLRSKDRNQKNTPLNVEYVIKKIARLRRTDFETMENQTEENARRLFEG